MAGQRTNEWKLGLFVVTGLTVGLAAILWLGANKFEREIIPAWTYFDESVQGLDTGSAVKFRGVTIGTVAQIGVAPDRRRVAVLMHIYADVLASLGLRKRGQQDDPDQPFVPTNVRVQLASAGITGVKFLSIDLFDPKKQPMPELNFVVPWNYIPAAPSTLRNLEETVLRLADEIPEGVADAKALLKEARAFLAAVDAPALSKDAQGLMTDARAAIAAADAPALKGKIEALLASLERAAERLDGLAADVARYTSEGGQVDGLITDVREATRSVREAVDGADIAATTSSLRATAGSVTDLSRELGGASGELRQALVALRDAAEKVADLAEVLERDPGSLIHGRSRGAEGPGGRR
jgi:paraquat-inducible protein B